MPTTPEEALQINQVVDDYIPLDKMRQLIGRLVDEVGLTTKNYSLRKTLLMLRQLYDPTYQVPGNIVSHLRDEYQANADLQNVTEQEYIGLTDDEYCSVVGGTYPECCDSHASDSS
jgi:hypothetical protein